MRYLSLLSVCEHSHMHVLFVSKANKLKVCMSKAKRLELNTLDLTSVSSSSVLNSQAFFRITKMLIRVIASGKIENSRQKCIYKGNLD